MIEIGGRNIDPSLVLLDPDPDQLTSDVVTLAQRVQSRSGMVFLDDL